MSIFSSNIARDFIFFSNFLIHFFFYTLKCLHNNNIIYIIRIIFNAINHSLISIFLMKMIENTIRVHTRKKRHRCNVNDSLQNVLTFQCDSKIICEKINSIKKQFLNLKADNVLYEIFNFNTCTCKL